MESEVTTKEELEKLDPKSSYKKKIKVKKPDGLWMMTFADLSFILMCFFALLLSMSKPNVKRFENVIQGLSKKNTVSKGKTAEAKNLLQVFKQVQKEIQKKETNKNSKRSLRL